MNHSLAHSTLVNTLLVELSKIPYCRVWKQHSGLLYTKYGAALKIGTNGMTDIGGIIMCSKGAGLYLAIECKTGSGVLTEEQRNFRNMVISNGGCHIIARDKKKTVEKVKQYMRQN